MAVDLYPKQEFCIACGEQIFSDERRAHRWRDFRCRKAPPHFHVKCGGGAYTGCGWQWIEAVALRAKPLSTQDMHPPAFGGWLGADNP